METGSIILRQKTWENMPMEYAEVPTETAGLEGQ